MPDCHSVRVRLRDIAETFPGSSIEDGQHLIFRVRGRTFGYYLEDHHGDGEVAMVCKVAPGLNQHLVGQDPIRYFMPAYVGPRGWIAVRLDRADADWDEIADLLFESYCSVAPRKLIAQANARRGESRRD